MDVVRAVGGRDHEDYVGRPVVVRPEVHRLGQPGEAKARGEHVGAAAVRDRHAAGNAGGRGRLAREGVSGQAVGVVGAPGVPDLAREEFDDVSPVRPRRRVQGDEFGSDERRLLAGLLFGHGFSFAACFLVCGWFTGFAGKMWGCFEGGRWFFVD